MHDVRRQRRRKADRQPMKFRVGAHRLDVADGIDVALDKMPAQTTVGAQRPLEVHAASAWQPAECRHAGGFGADIGMDLEMFRDSDRETDAVDREAVAWGQFGRHRRADPEPEARLRRRTLDQLADAFNETGEHNPLSTRRGRAVRHADPIRSRSKTGARPRVERPRHRARAA